MAKEIKDTKLYKVLEERDSQYKPQLDLAINLAADMLALINKVFDTYTIHGITHKRLGN